MDEVSDVTTMAWVFEHRPSRSFSFPLTDRWWRQIETHAHMITATQQHDTCEVRALHRPSDAPIVIAKVMLSLAMQRCPIDYAIEVAPDGPTIAASQWWASWPNVRVTNVITSNVIVPTRMVTVPYRVRPTMAELRAGDACVTICPDGGHHRADNNPLREVAHAAALSLMAPKFAADI